MKSILLAPNSFKESASGIEVCESLEEGLRIFDTEISILNKPIADGGDGTIDSVCMGVSHSKKLKTMVEGPSGDPVLASWALIDRTAIIEMAQSSGLARVDKALRDPYLASSYGLGQLIRSAMDNNAEKLIIGLGGSATNDGGAGMLMALGYKFHKKNGSEITKGNAGLADLFEIHNSPFHTELQNLEIKVASDVVNPLLGPNGAIQVYGPQKGANKADLAPLEENLKRFASIAGDFTGSDHINTAGAGAAGGTGFGIMTFLNASMYSGFKLLADLVDLNGAIQESDIVITGEGSLDSQTLSGKGPFGVAQIAKKFGKPVLAVCGKSSLPKELDLFDKVYEIAPPGTSVAESMENVKEFLRKTGERIGADYLSK